jgi:hypothetical protein
MTYFTTVQDANEEKLNRPWLEIEWNFCACGSLEGYYKEYNPITNKYDEVYACDECYINCHPDERK